MAEQPESLQESQALVTPTQTAVPSRGHCSIKQPALGLQCPHCSDVGAHSLAPAAEGKDEGQFSPVEVAHSASLLSRGSQGCRTCLLTGLVPGHLPNVTYFAPRQAASCAALDSITLEERLLDTGSLHRYGACSDRERKTDPQACQSMSSLP